MFRTFALATAISLGFGLAAAPAAAQDFVPERLVGSIDLADLKSVVVSLDHELVEEQPYGDVSVSARDPDGTGYVLIGTACNANGVPGCQGVMMQVRFDPEETVTDAGLARANLEQAAVNTWRDPANGTIGITRYVVLDHGITMANLRENLVVLLSLAPGVVEALLEE